MNETNELWRSVKEDRTRRQEEQRLEWIRRFEALKQAGYIQSAARFTAHHLRVQRRVGAEILRVDVWPSTGRFRRVEDKARARKRASVGWEELIGTDRLESERRSAVPALRRAGEGCHDPRAHGHQGTVRRRGRAGSVGGKGQKQ